MLNDSASSALRLAEYNLAQGIPSLSRDADSARSALDLVSIAQEFSPRYQRHRDDLLTVDVRGLERLLGPPRVIAPEIRREAADRGARVHVAIAGTQTAAMVLALANPGIIVIDPGDESAALSQLSISLLEKIPQDDPNDSTNAIAVFKKWGLRTLGELGALPAADLAARLGRRGAIWQAIARGEDLGPLVPDLPEERFESTLELEWPIEELEPLSFVLTRLLEPLSIRLERRDRGAAVLHVTLRLVTAEVYARRLELPTPMRDVRTLRTLALLDLESHPPSAGIDRVTVAIDPTPGQVLQHKLFTRAHATPEQLSTLLARLGALMGQDRIGAPATIDSYRPGAFEMKVFATEHRGAEDLAVSRGRESTLEAEVRSAEGCQLVSALRRCRQPVPARVAVVDGRPVRVTSDRRSFPGGSVLACTGPWRTSGNWWNTGSGGPGRPGGSDRSEQTYLTCWNRDEWDVSLSDGAVYRIFQDHETDRWFIDAIVD
jgi:protein ImuB